MHKVAVYARYSTADQSPASIQDQIRRCQKTLAAEGIVAEKEYIFQDSAISGSASAQKKRVGYADLIRAIQNGQITCLVADELSRLSRDLAEIGTLRDLIVRKNVLFFTVNGLDSRSPGWGIRMLFSGVMGQEEVLNLRHMTKRGMQGQLDRGFMLAAPAYGYRGVQVDATGQPAVGDDIVGTIWKIDESTAAVVCQIYQERSQGKSLNGIARMLNTSGILPPRPRQGEKSVWLASTVLQILKNRIYTGIFVYRGSASYRYQAAKTGEDTEKETEYSRPELRIVSDEIWHSCNANKGDNHSGGKPINAHILNGLVYCGVCGGILALSASSKKNRVLYCANCQRKKAVGADVETQTTAVSVKGVEELLKQVLLETLSEPDVMDAFRAVLRSKLMNGERDRIRCLQQEIQALGKAYKRLLDQFVSGDDSLKTAVESMADKYRALKAEQDSLSYLLTDFDKKAIDAQLAIDPSQVIYRLLGSTGKNLDRLRPILKRLFPTIKLLGRTQNRATIFEVHTNLGVAISEATKTRLMERGTVVRHYTARASRTQPIWHIEPYNNSSLQAK